MPYTVSDTNRMLMDYDNDEDAALLDDSVEETSATILTLAATASNQQQSFRTDFLQTG